MGLRLSARRLATLSRYAQLRDPRGLDPYRHLGERVARRWGPGMLQQHPYLWYFAEYSPEHLNEVGVAWLADRIAPMLLK